MVPLPKVVLGGGISGLTAAYSLSRRGFPVILAESSDRLGGWVNSKRLGDGQVYEIGPRAMRVGTESSVTALKLVDDLEIKSQLVPISRNDPTVRSSYIVREGRIQKLDFGTGAFFLSRPPLNTPLISLIHHDLFTPRGNGEDESLHHFVKRRFGVDAADFLADPMCRGIFAGDSAHISVRSMLPMAFNLEQKYGSVVWGYVRFVLANLRSPSKAKLPKAKRLEFRSPKTAFEIDSRRDLLKHAEKGQWARWTMQGGLQSLTDAIANHLRKEENATIHIGSPCKSIIRKDTKKNTLEVDIGHMKIETDHVFSAVPSFVLSDVVRAVSPELSSKLTAIESVDVAVVNLEYEKSDASCPEGFGYLIPSFETDSLCLGMIFDKSQLPQRKIFTAMLGGAWFHEIFGSNPTEEFLVSASRKELQQRLGITASPVRHSVSILKKCIPQHTVGHIARVADMRECISGANLPLTLLGASYDGVSVNDCIHNTIAAIQNLNLA